MLKHPKESFHNNFVSLDCDQCTMVTQHGKPMFTQVLAVPVDSPAPYGSDQCALVVATVLCGLLGLACALSHGRQGQATGRVPPLCRVGFQGMWAWGSESSLCLTLHPAQVCVEGRLYLEFMFDDMMRIKTWHFSIRQHRELIPRSILAMHVSTTPELPWGMSDMRLLSYSCSAG